MNFSGKEPISREIAQSQKDKEYMTLFRVPILDSDFYACVFMWEQVCVEARELEKGPREGEKQRPGTQLGRVTEQESRPSLWRHSQ